MRRVILSLVMTATLMLTFQSNILATEEYSDIQLSQISGERFVHEKAAAFSSEWSSAELDAGTPCHDLDGNVIAYMFTIVNEGQTEGFIVVGNSRYNYTTIEASTKSRPVFPSLEVIVSNSQKLGVTLNCHEPVLTYLGYGRYYAVYGSGTQKLGFDMITGKLLSNEELYSSFSEPPESQNNVNERNLNGDSDNGILSLVLLNVPIQDMSDGSLPAGYRNNNNCGPTSGAMISEYWRESHNLSSLPTWTSDHNELYVLQYCNNWFPYYHGVPPWTFGDGITQFWEDNGYSGYTSDWCVNRGFDKIEDEIDSGRPMGVMFSYNLSYTNWHWCVVTGYFTDGYIAMNDPWGGVSSVYWDYVKDTSVITRIYPD